jgi:hypothetical protein
MHVPDEMDEELERFLDQLEAPAAADDDDDPRAKSVNIELTFWIASRTLARSFPFQPSAPGKRHLSGGWSPVAPM